MALKSGKEWQSLLIIQFSKKPSLIVQRATQLVCWAANIATYQISPTVGRTLSLKSHHQQSAATGHLIIDSGTNVSVMGCT